jgi:hypothetical protein
MEMIMLKSATLAIATLAALASVGAAHAQTTATTNLPLIQISDGCGPNGWRGPGGHCHFSRYYGAGPYPYVYFAWGYNGCPPGYWHGPWGHCRDTPYHGRLPSGRWQ